MAEQLHTHHQGGEPLRVEERTPTKVGVLKVAMRIYKLAGPGKSMHTKKYAAGSLVNVSDTLPS